MGLTRRVEADERLPDLSVDVVDGFSHTLSQVPPLVAITQLDGFSLPRGRARRHGRPPEGTARQGHVDFNGRGASAVQDLVRDNLSDRVFASHASLAPSLIGRSAPQRSCKTSTPGSAFPPKNSNDAPPPVDTCVIRSATPACSIAAAESPPPTIVVAPGSSASARATATVPAANGASSKTPMGPFHTTVRAVWSRAVKRSTVLGPMSRICHVAGTLSTAAVRRCALASHRSANDHIHGQHYAVSTTCEKILRDVELILLDE